MSIQEAIDQVKADETVTKEMVLDYIKPLLEHHIIELDNFVDVLIVK